MKSIVTGLACFLVSVVGCAASAPPPVSPDLSVAPSAPSADAPSPSPQASPVSSAPSVPCSPEVVGDYCPEQGAPQTCTDPDGKVENILRCSTNGGHCNGRSCVKGSVACDSLKQGDVRTGVACDSRGLSCTWMSRMGNAWCSCGDNGKWNCDHAGI